MGNNERRRKTREGAKPAAVAETAEPRKGAGWRRHGWRLLAIWGLLAVAYSNSFQSGLVFDNGFIIERDPRIREATVANVGAILSGEYSYVSIGAGLYRPLTTLSYLLNYAVLGNGTHPAGYHAVNLLLHAANVALVYALGLLVCGSPTAAWALAAFWGLHPLATESVTNIVGRADLLAAMGVLAGLLCYVRSAAAEGRRRLAWLAGVVCAQALGLFSKESAVVLPGLMLLYDLVWAERSAWRKRLPAYAALLLPLAAFFYLRSGLHTGLRIEFAENPLASAGFWAGRLTAVKVIGKYLWLFVWPARLSADYSYNAVPVFDWGRSWEDVKAVIALAVCLGAAALGVLLAARRRGKEKALLFFLAFFFVALAPVSNVFLLIGSIMAERFVYLPAVGLAGCVVAAVSLLGERALAKGAAASRLAWVLALLVCVGLAARTYARNLDWQDDRSLWSSAAEAYPESSRPHYNLANTLVRMPGMLPEAIEQYQEAMRIRPDNPDIHNNLGMALVDIPERVPEAIAEFQEALRLNPNAPQVHSNLGIALSKIPERAPEAVGEFEIALRATPHSAELHNALGLALAQTPGRMQDAIAEFQEALRIKPDLAEAHANYGRALSEMPGRVEEAIAELREALRSKPDSPVTHNNLGVALERIPQSVPEAIGEFQAALRIAPDYADAHYNLGLLLARIPGKQAEAIAELEAGERISPDDVRLRVLEQLRGR